MKKFLVLLTFCLTSSLWAQTMTEAKITNMTSKRLTKDFNQHRKLLNFDEDYYYIRKVRSINDSRKLLAGRTHEIYIYTKFSCFKAKNMKEEFFGECSVVLEKRFAKMSNWTSHVDKGSKCFCGDRELY